MSSKVVRVRCLGVGGTTTVNLDRCREFSIGPPIIPGELPVDRSQYGIYYLTPDLRWVAECHISPDRVYYQETTRNAVRNHAFRVGHYPLPRELQTEHYSDKEKTPPPSLRPSRPGVPMVTFNLDPEEIRQFRGVSHGTVKSVDEEMTAGPPPRENEQPAAAPASGTEAPEDRDQQIADLLKANGNITSLEIARRVKTSDSTVRRSTPWTEHQSRKANHRREKTIRKRALTRGVLASKAGGDEDPSELAAEREVVAQQYLADVDPETSDDDEARYLDQASPEELLDYRQMSPAEQKHTVKTWLHYNV